MPYKCSEKARAKRLEYYRNNREACLAYSRQYNKDHAEELAAKRKIYSKSYKEKNMKQYLLSAAKFRAKKKGVIFNLSLDDFEIPDVCPVFGCPFKSAEKGNHPYAPSLDRIIPELGYVKGNVQVISYRANAIKWDSSLEELEKIVAYLRRVTPEQS